MPKPVTPSVAQPGQAAPVHQGQRIAAHGQTIYVQQRGVDPRWIAIASVTATLIALLFVAVVLWNYRNQPAPQQAPLIINVNSGQHGTTTTVTPQSAVASAPPAPTPASATSTASPTPTATPAPATPSATVAAVAAPAAAPQPTAAPVAVTPPAKPPGSAPGNAPAVKRDATAPAAAAASVASAAGSAPRSAIPEAGENLTKPVAPTRLGPPEPTPTADPATATASNAAPAPEAPADAPRSGASKAAATVVPWNEANQYMGKLITIEGTVVSARNTGSVCFLNFDKNWQGKFYIAIVEPSAMTAWPKPPQEHFLNQKIRVTGKVSLYQDRPQMRITQAESITIVAE